ncbi:MAG: hypothetical protein Q4B79_00580 [Moraxella sp.]|uniref:hypothetical protein n=1 Tax=Moraxella sp. TaxID=479 RepID=UPI0026DB6A12|nr:hypothetical protein [Moraxella sp.]MDO4449439.1 hypothetical protein [Moraxella sp.]
MKKIALVSLAMLFTQSVFANTATSAPSLVGDWLCEATLSYEGGGITQVKNRLSYQPSGWASEVVQVNRYHNGALQATTNIRLGYQWELLGGRQKISNMMIDVYEVYDHVTGKALGFGEAAVLKQNLLNQYQQDPWQTIAFVNDHMHQYIADDGSKGVCVRES